MADSTYFVSCEELYEMVWTTPPQKLSKKFGISDIALGMCRGQPEQFLVIDRE